MKLGIRVLLITLLAVAFSVPAGAHFQELIPSTDIVTGRGDRNLSLSIVFGHPMENATMEMAKPARFGVLVKGEKQDLSGSLEPSKALGHQAWKASYKIKRPGDHIFFVEPAPYWEPAESRMIIHYTKVVVDAMGMEEGWDKPVGFPVEIVPLTRPYGLWTGNLFRGVVLKDGNPVPGAGVEVEFLNRDGKVVAPSDPYLTQRIKTDTDGVFSYAMPRAGWWGFAALLEGDKPMKNPAGENVPVETGGLIWVRTRDMNTVPGK